MSHDLDVKYTCWDKGVLIDCQCACCFMRVTADEHGVTIWPGFQPRPDTWWMRLKVAFEVLCHGWGWVWDMRLYIAQTEELMEYLEGWLEVMKKKKGEHK